MPLKLLWLGRVRRDVDVTTVYLDLQPSAVEQVIRGDSAVVYLDLQPASVYIQVDNVLEIVGSARRWMIDAPLTRWQTAGAQTRWGIIEMFARWTLMQTRRLVWRR